jgi:hypothetical protein
MLITVMGAVRIGVRDLTLAARSSFAVTPIAAIMDDITTAMIGEPMGGTRGTGDVRPLPAAIVDLTRISKWHAVTWPPWE